MTETSLNALALLAIVAVIILLVRSRMRPRSNDGGFIDPEQAPRRDDGCLVLVSVVVILVGVFLLGLQGIQVFMNDGRH